MKDITKAFLTRFLVAIVDGIGVAIGVTLVLLVIANILAK